ncbi:hypothetical protein LWI28_013726 [Acer negundo]|uniref:Uncharacterized protein n=1 Tax=Acer negundo TaxID=4023 RepID=A0AAD5NS28_ACENE|nr:hypothetical protein LWI28_013726 [Acer negundo]
MGTIVENQSAYNTVSIDVVVDEDESLPIPNEVEGLIILRDALGHQTLWPKELILDESMSLVSCAGYQAGDPSQSALGMTKLAPPRPNKLTDVKKEEGPKHAHLVRPNKPSILELEAKLGHNQGNKGKGVRKALKVHAFMEREPSTFNKGDVVQAFRRIGLGGGLSSLSLTPALGSNASLPWNNWLYLFRRRCAFERRRADVEAQLNQVELALVHLSAVKWKAEQTQVMIAGQVICWKLDLEKEVIRSTPHSYERNELRKKLVVKEKEMEAVPSKGDAGTAKVQDKGEDKNGEDLKGAGVGSGGYEGHRA